MIEADTPLVSTFSDDPEMTELVEMFVGELPERVEAINEALGSDDAETLRTLVHQLKGAAGGYGFDPITEAARVVEEQIKAEEALASLSGSVEQLSALCKRARA